MTAAQRRGAEIVVSGGGGTERAAAALLRAELDGVRYVRFTAADAATVSRELPDADMLVFVVDADDGIDAACTATVAAVARRRGMLVAALIARASASAGPSPTLAALRDAADIVVMPRAADDITAIVAALR